VSWEAESGLHVAVLFAVEIQALYFWRDACSAMIVASPLVAQGTPTWDSFRSQFSHEEDSLAVRRGISRSGGENSVRQALEVPRDTVRH
jgi:hypothetical protein